jgi:CRISPR/Cas system-associated exonuclease Cas4 (RecB family)
LFRFEGETEYALKQDWRYIINSGKETAHSSRDAKFQIDSKELSSVPFLIIYNTPGVPAGLTGTAVSDPFSLQASSALKGKASLTIRANEEGALKIMGWNGSSWKEFETTVDGKMATANVDLMELYIAVKP